MRKHYLLTDERKTKLQKKLIKDRETFIEMYNLMNNLANKAEEIAFDYFKVSDDLLGVDEYDLHLEAKELAEYWNNMKEENMKFAEYMRNLLEREQR